MMRFGRVVALVGVLALGVVAGPRAALAQFPFTGNFTLWDDFASLLLDRNRWTPIEPATGGSATPNTETFRGIVQTKTGPQAQLMLHTWGNQGAGNTGGSGLSQQRLDFTSPENITTIIALMTVTKATANGCTANTDTTTRARAQIQGRFFNAGGSPPSDLTGDVMAGIQLAQDSQAKALLQGFVTKCTDGTCSDQDDLVPGQGVFVTKWALNQARYYGIQWDQPNHRFITAVLDQNFNTIETQVLDYSGAGISDTEAPFAPRKSIRVNNSTANCAPPGKRTDAFMSFNADNVWVNQ